MPEQNNDQNNSSNNNGKGSNVIELMLGNERKQFAGVDELKAEVSRLYGEASEATKLKGEVGRLGQMEELVKAAVITGSPEAERKLYKSIGLTDKQIAKILKSKSSIDDDDIETDDDDSVDDFDDDDDDNDDVDNRAASRRSSKSGRNGQQRSRSGPVDIDAITNKVIASLKGKIGFSQFDEPSIKYMEELVARVEAASGVVAETSLAQTEQQLASDKVVGSYWNRLNERQKKAALAHTLRESNVAIKRGRRVSEDDIRKMKDVMRNFLADVYGDPNSFRRNYSSGEVPTVLDIEADSTGFEDISDDELETRRSKLNSVASSDGFNDTGRGPQGLAERMQIAHEMSKRNAARRR